MADKTIAELPAATSVGSGDLFVLEQSNAAKKLTGQILENWLVSFADGHGGIQSIAKTGTSGTNPVVDTYTITLADETTSTFTVTNGIKGDTGAQTYVWVKWAAQNPTADNQMSNNPDEWIGLYVGLASTAPTHYTDYTWYKYKGERGNPGYAVDEVVWHDSTGGNAPGIAGATDTYYMYLNDPNSTFTGQFIVYNGQDGQGAPGSQTPLSDSGSGVVGAATAYSREDHRHPLNVDNTNPAQLGTAAPGSAGTYARRDHVHKMPTASDVGALSSKIVNNKNVKVVAGVARYSNGEWTLLNDTGHNPLNAVIASGQTDPGTFTVSHSVGASKVLSLVCGPDEGYAAQGVTCGASVGLDYSVFNVRWPKMAASTIGYNGSAYTHEGVPSISSEDIVQSVSVGSSASLGSYLKINLATSYPGLFSVFSANQYDWKVLGYGLYYINIQPYLNGTKQSLPLESGGVSLTVAKQTTGVPETIDHSGCNIWFLGIFEI